MSRRGQIWLYSLALAFVLLGLIAAVTHALAQGGPLQQGGAITPGHVARFVTNGVVGDGGSAQNGTVTEIGITGQGTPFCLTDGPVTGPYHQLCFGANSLGGGLISFQAYNGAPVTPLMCNINGVQTECELSASNVSNIAGPLSVAGNITGAANISAGGNITAGGAVNAATANISGDLGVAGNVFTGGIISGPNGIVSNGPLEVTSSRSDFSGDLGVAGNVFAGGIISGTDGIISNGPLEVNGRVDISDALGVAGNVFAAGLIVGTDGINSNGVLVVNNDAFANSWQINSDSKLKTDVRDFKVDATAALKKLHPVSYRFETHPGRHVGLIADEVQHVIPEAVGEHKGVKTLDPMALIDVLITANRELAERVEALEKRVSARP